MSKNPISVVTGGTGFVGSHLVDLLLGKGHEVRCITRKSSSMKWLEGKNVKIFDCGLYNEEALEEVLAGTDYLFHVAGVVKAKTAEDYYKGNVLPAINLMNVTRKANPSVKKVVVVSSQTACGPSPGAKAIDEEYTPKPITRYGKSKLEEENEVRKFMNDLPISIVRAPAVFGDRDTEIFLVLKTFSQGLMTMVGFDRKLVSIIYVKDLVKGIYLAAENDVSAGQTYFISSEEYYDWNRIGDAIAAGMGKKALRLRIPHPVVYTVAAIAEFFSMFSKKAATFNLEKARDFVQRYWTCDTGKAVRELGFKQDYTLEEGMKSAIDWYRENKWL